MLVHCRIPSMKWLEVLQLSPGWNVSSLQDTQHEVTGSIITLPGWNVSSLQDTQHEMTRSIITLPRMEC